MITNIDIDEAIVAEAMRLSGARTKREVVDRALREMVARASRPSIRELFGTGGIDPDYDHKAARGAGPWVRVEEPRAVYAAPAPVKKAAAAKEAKAVKPAAPRKPR
ncbi:MAG: type II toxin-antitoxin system VapB family antitoxin [Pseudomonadota bacterium]